VRVEQSSNINKFLGPYYKSKLELKSKSVFISFFFALKVRLKDLKFEFCQFKLEPQINLQFTGKIVLEFD